MNWFYGHNLFYCSLQVCHRQTCIKALLGFLRAQALKQGEKGGRDKLGFTDLIWFAVRLQFCISKIAVNKILGTKENVLKAASAVFIL